MKTSIKKSDISNLTSEVSNDFSILGSNISTLLVANRGEISSRISRTCKAMGIRSVAVFSDADRDSLYVKDADIAIHIGESRPSKSYLDQDKILEVAKKVGADAIHPGYGFLSENAEFAKRCAEERIIFIGPHPDAISKMGSKSEAKKIMQDHDVPTVPGYQGSDQSKETLIIEAHKIGYPLLLKATAGGGGKGMRIVRKAKELDSAIEAAKREAKSAFGDDQLIIEKYIESGRHIEFQIFGDKHGHVVHLLERECSIQRRYQKIIEESPSPVMSKELRDKMSKAAISAAKALDYDNAGTVEFIYDDRSGDFYFLEVNTRLQVEHPVTEEITGLDLVQMQIDVAQGKPLALRQEDVSGDGYAIEVRLYAEDPENDFMPVIGKILKFEIPKIEGLRVESAIQSGSEISIFYDPMIAKIIMKGKNRYEAIRKLNFSLRHMICQGTKTNQDFLIRITNDKDFQEGKYNTHFVQEFQSRRKEESNERSEHLSLISLSTKSHQQRVSKRKLLAGLPSGWRNSHYEDQHGSFLIGEREYKVQYRHYGGHINYTIGALKYKVLILESSQDKTRIEIDGMIYSFDISNEKNTYYVHNEELGNYIIEQKPRFPESSKENEKGGYITPMPAQIIKVLGVTGDTIKSGDELIIISSMKMESTVFAHEDGVIEELYVEEGQNVPANFELLKIKSNS